MKKLAAISLAAVLALSLAACGGGSESDETSSPNVEATLNLDENEYLLTLVKNVYNQSIPSGDGVSVYGLELSKSENAARFAMNFVDKPCQLTGVVFQINSDNVILGYALAGEMGTIGANGGVKVYLDTDELINLNNLDTIAVSSMLVDDENNEVTAILENAHIVE